MKCFSMVWDHKVAPSNCPHYGLVEMAWWRCLEALERLRDLTIQMSFPLFLKFCSWDLGLSVFLTFFCVDTASGESGGQLCDR